MAELLSLHLNYYLQLNKFKYVSVIIQSGMVVPMILAIILDGIPESIVIGLGIFKEGTISSAMLVAVFKSNLPESIAASSGMRTGGWTKSRIFWLWLFIAVVYVAATVAGFSLFSGLSVLWISFIQAFAGSAILIMLANSMISKSYEHAGKIAGLFTILGFFISVSVVILEHSH